MQSYLIEKMKKTFLFFAIAFMLLVFYSCRKEKCGYYWDISDYYDSSEAAWILRYEQGYIDSVDLQNQLYKINRERETLKKQNKDCVEN